MVTTTAKRQWRDEPSFTKDSPVYNAKRDCYRNGGNLAMPSMGEIEGRITVLEVVAMTSLSLLVKAGDKHAAQQALSAIRRAMRLKCKDIKLSSSDSDSAIAYAQELDWMRSNPSACLQVEESGEHHRWKSVVVQGTYQELPDTAAWHNERLYAWSLLQKRSLWWEPGSFKPGTGSEDKEAPIFFSISIAQISGRELVAS